MQNKNTNPIVITSHVEAIFNQLKGESWIHGDMVKKNVEAGQKEYTLMFSQKDPSILQICQKSTKTVEILPLIYLKDGGGKCARFTYPKETVHTSSLDQHLMIWEVTWRKANEALPKEQQLTLMFPVLGRGGGVLF